MTFETSFSTLIGSVSALSGMIFLIPRQANSIYRSHDGGTHCDRAHMGRRCALHVRDLVRPSPEGPFSRAKDYRAAKGLPRTVE